MIRYDDIDCADVVINKRYQQNSVIYRRKFGKSINIAQAKKIDKKAGDDNNNRKKVGVVVIAQNTSISIVIEESEVVRVIIGKGKNGALNVLDLEVHI